MQQVIFRKISYWNFMSFADESWDFNSSGSIFLISGRNNDLKADDSGRSASNGSGKTNLIQGAMYALYGQFPYKIHNANIINKYSKTPDSESYIMRVTMEFDIVNDEGAVSKYKIIRGVQKGSQGTIRLSLFNLKESGEWEDISKSSSAITQQYIEELVKMNFAVFQRLAMVTFDSNFNFFKMSASQKRDFIEMLFDTSVYNSMWELIKKDQSRFLMALQGEKVKLNTLQGQLVNCENDIKQFTASARDNENRLTEELKAMGENVKSLKTQQQELTESIDKIRGNVTELDTKMQKIKDSYDKIKAAMQSNTHETAMTQNMKDNSLREIQKHNRILSLVCDDCCGKIKKEYGLDEYEREIEKCEIQLQQLSGARVKLQAALDKVNNLVSSLNDEKFKVDMELRNKESNLTGLQIEERGLIVKGDELKRQIKEIQDSLSDPHKIPMLTTWKALKSNIKSCESEIGKQEDDNRILSYCEKAVCPDSIRENIVSRVVKSINDLINQFLKELNIDIKCELDDRLDKYTILAPEGWHVDYQNLSMGEQMKLLLASQLAFRKFLLMRFNLSCNCFILDEVIDQNFDTLSISRILNLLLDMASVEKIHIYMISHRSEVSTLVDDLIESKPELRGDVHRILVEKNNNVSTIISD